MAAYNSNEKIVENLKSSPHRILDKCKISPSSRKETILNMMPLKSKKIPVVERPMPVSATYINVNEPLPAYLFESSNTQNVTTIEQRLAQPDLQPNTYAEMQPLHMLMQHNHFLRCKKCDYTLIRQEYNPTSSKFKVQNFAISYLPVLTIFNLPEFHLNKESRVIMTFTNMSSKEMVVSLQECETPFTDWANAKVKLPDSKFTLTPYSVIQSQSPVENDTSEIHRRFKNKLSFYIHVTPTNETAEDIRIEFAVCMDMPVIEIKSDVVTYTKKAFDICLNLGRSENVSVVETQ